MSNPEQQRCTGNDSGDIISCRDKGSNVIDTSETYRKFELAWFGLGVLAGVMATIRIIVVVGILLGHWAIRQFYTLPDPPINPADPVVFLVLAGALVASILVMRKYRSFGLGLLVSVPLSWATSVLLYSPTVLDN